MTTLHRVALVGFGTFERSTFDLFFRTSQLRAQRPPAAHAGIASREHGYVLVAAQDDPELLLINGDLRLAVRQAWRWPGRCVSIGAASFAGAIAHIQRPVPMSHLLEVLDELVLHQPTASDWPHAGAAPEDPATGLRVLVVDDNDRTRRSIARCFVRAGLEASYADSGEEALYRVAQRPYALVLLDAQMTGISGWLTCRLIKDRPYPRGRTAPRVLIMARDGGLRDRWRLARCRGDGRILKPLHTAALLAAVQPYL
jgi:CheY-like chemotaxis protein